MTWWIEQIQKCLNRKIMSFIKLSFFKIPVVGELQKILKQTCLTEQKALKAGVLASNALESGEGAALKW